MKKILIGALFTLAAVAQAATTVPPQLINPTGSTAGQGLVSTGSVSAPAWADINAKTLGGATFAAPTPIGSTTPNTGTFTNLSAANVFTVRNGSDIINASNNSNNVLVFSGTGTSTAKFIATTSMGGFIAAPSTTVNDGVAIRSDFINTVVLQGLNASGTAGYDTNLTLYRPANTNNAFLGVTMSANPSAEQHLWMGTDYSNNRYVFTQTITGAGSYLPTAFRNGQADAFIIGSGTTPPTTFYGGGVVLAGTEGNQVTWALGGQIWSINTASGGDMYVHDGTYNKFPLTFVKNSTAALRLSGSTSAFTGSVSATGSGVMPLYSTAGAAVNAPHMVQGSVTLASGTATVTLAGSAVYTSSSSYTCTANDMTTANAVKVSQGSGTSITFTGTGTDVVQFSCVGN